MGHGSPGPAHGMVGATDGASGLSVENRHCTAEETEAQRLGLWTGHTAGSVKPGLGS